jgi:hypothetical protein
MTEKQELEIHKKTIKGVTWSVAISFFVSTLTICWTVTHTYDAFVARMEVLSGRIDKVEEEQKRHTNEISNNSTGIGVLRSDVNLITFRVANLEKK